MNVGPYVLEPHVCQKLQACKSFVYPLFCFFYLANQHIKTMEEHPGKHSQALMTHISKTRRKIYHSDTNVRLSPFLFLICLRTTEKHYSALEESGDVSQDGNS